MMAVVAAGILALAGAASAAVSTVAQFHMGEDGDTPLTALKDAMGGPNAVREIGTTFSIVEGDTGAMGSTKYLDTEKSLWYVNPGIGTGVLGTTNWGMDVWLKMPTLAAANAKADAGRPTSNIMSNGSLNNSMGMQRVSTDNFMWSMAGVGAQTVSVDNSLFDTWVHAAFVYNGNNNMQLYINGQPLATLSRNANYVTGRQSYLFIGTVSNNTAGNQWMGGMDELRVFTFDQGNFNISDIYSPIPEPATMSLLVVGGVAALIRRRRS